MCASPLNAWGAANWRSFSTQNYFDKNGVFMSALFTAPLILVLLVQLVLIARHLANLAVAAGKLKVKSFAREKEAKKKMKNGKRGQGRGGKKGAANTPTSMATANKKKTS
jgi:hypothetical protein